MRKTSIFLFVIVLYLTGQNHKKIKWGAGIGWGVTPVVFHSGDPYANVRFKANHYSSFNLFLSARRDFNEKWAIMGSVEVGSVGFEYVFLNNEYNLKRYRPHTLRQELSYVQFPLMGLYKTRLNCMNKRWIFGLGLVPSFIERKKITSITETNLNGTSSIYEIQTGNSTSSFCFGKWMIAREKVMRSGNMLMWGIEHLFIRQNAATSEINYTYNGKNYNHVFKNTGNHTGIFLRYLFGN